MKIYIFLSLLLISCTTQKSRILKKQNFSLQVYQQEYSLTFEEESDSSIKMSSSIIEEESVIKIFKNKNEPKLYEGSKDPQGRLLHHANYPEVTFTRIMVVPYYSLMGYNILTQVKRYEDGMYAPECPLETKYLVIFQINNGPLPLFGCAL